MQRMKRMQIMQAKRMQAKRMESKGMQPKGIGNDWNKMELKFMKLKIIIN